MVSGPAIVCPTDELHACLERLSTIDASSLSGEEQAALIQELSRAEARVTALKLKVLAAAEKSQTARRAGAGSTGQWAARLSRSDGAEAQRQVALAGRLARRTATQQALALGQISTAHADVIVRADTQLPATTTADQRATVEAALLAKARTMSPSTRRRAARRAIEALRGKLAAAGCDTGEKISAGEADASRAEQASCPRCSAPGHRSSISAEASVSSPNRSASRSASSTTPVQPTVASARSPGASYTIDNVGATWAARISRRGSRCVTSIIDGYMTLGSCIARCPTAASGSVGERESVRGKG